MERKIYLVRHGRPDLPDNELRFLGRTDLPLSEEGIQQARKLNEVFRNSHFDHVFHSGMQRTAQTASLIFENRAQEMKTVPEFKEIAFGEWETLSLKELSLNDPEAFEARGRDFAGFRPPGGENFLDVQNRAYPAFRKIVGSTEGNVMIVGHAGMFKSIIIKELGLSFQQLFSFRMDYCGVTVFSQFDEYLSLLRLNWTPEI